MQPKEFNDLENADESLIKEFLLMQGHATDGSALNAGCHCIESKHTYKAQGHAEEAVTFTDEAKRKQFYEDVAALMRSLRRGIENEWFSMADVLSDSGIPLMLGGHRVKVVCEGPDCPH